MNVIGFNFTKISSSRELRFPKGYEINTNIEFINMERESITILKELDSIRIDFTYAINYTDEDPKKSKQLASIQFEGNILLTVSKEESKEILKNWKKKKPAASLKMAIFNLILKKCTIKALTMEEEIGIPPHHQHAIPQIRAKKKEE
jgi:hypothetical protein